jgi:hypothetical protein
MVARRFKVLVEWDREDQVWVTMPFEGFAQKVPAWPNSSGNWRSA